MTPERRRRSAGSLAAQGAHYGADATSTRGAERPVIGTPRMPVPLPDTTELLPPPRVDEVFVTARAVVTAVQGARGLTDLQHHVLSAHMVAMTGVHVNPDYLEPIGPAEFAEAMRYRDEGFRSRMIQTMLLLALIIDPLPEEIVDRIHRYAYELSIDDDMIRVAQEQCRGARRLVGADFTRAGYGGNLGISEPTGPAAAGANTELWSEADDPILAGRWAALEHLPASTLGRRMWEFYRARGFQFPGAPGSASPYLSQHDWIHVIADYGSTVESEIEVFGLISRANDNPSGFALLAMVLSLFESGSLPQVAIFAQDAGYLTRNARHMGIRLADAMYRGAIIGSKFGGHDLMQVDWLSHAERDVYDVRRMLGIPPKSPASIRAGSIGPWAPGGISPFQLGLGRSMAERLGVEYTAYGATA